MNEDETRRPIFLAVDGSRCFKDASDLISSTMKGPIGPYIGGIKLNDVLHALFCRRFIKWTLVCWPKLAIFADLKLADISATNLNTVGRWADGEHETIVTVSLHCSPKTFVGLAKEYPNVWVAAMGIPTDWKREECVERYGMTPSEAMFVWLGCLRRQYIEVRADKALPNEPCRFAIASTDMLPMMAESFPNIKCITPGIRDEWMAKKRKDDTREQERTVGIAWALALGARYVVLGSQLTKGNPERGVSAEQSQELTAAAIESHLGGKAAEHPKSD